MNTFKKNIINTFVASFWIPSSIRVKLYRALGMKIYTNQVKARCFFNSELISIGKGSFINSFCQFHSSHLPAGKISIGENCYIAMNVTFCTITHEVGDAKQRAGDNVYYPIEIGNGSWVGANSTIMPNVKIGEGCIIASGSTVIKDCEANGIYAGTPAKRIKELA